MEILNIDEEKVVKQAHAAHFSKKTCAFCSEPIKGSGEETSVGPMHSKCVTPWKRKQALNVERCGYCDAALGEKRLAKGNVKIHPECQADWKAKKPYVKPTKMGTIDKFAMRRSTFGKKNWKTRHFVISPDIQGGGIAYYENMVAYDGKKAPKNELKITDFVRMVTQPNVLCHPKCTSASREICLVFPTPEVTEVNSTKPDHRLLLRFPTIDEKESYVQVLEKYVRVIDYPDDYMHPEDYKPSKYEKMGPK